MSLPSPPPTAAPLAAPARHVRYRPPRWAIALTLVLLLSGADGTPALRYADSLGAVAGAALERPAAYALLAPLCGLLDTLTVLTLSQHLSLLATLALVYVAWRWFRRGAASGTLLRRAGREVGIFAGALTALVAFYAAGTLVPRPMSALAMQSADDLIVDFHSHTETSWDSRKPFSLARRHAWHTAAGFNAVFVSDHGTFDGAPASAAPAGGRGAVLLRGAEARYHHQHVVLVGDPTLYRRLLVDGRVDSAAIHQLRADGLPDPLVVLTLPARLAQLPTGRDGTLAIGAIEISDASPKGLDFVARHRAELVRLADSLDVALVTATNHHGWGYTAPAWSVMTVPGWPAMSADSLAAHIASLLQRDGRAAVRVIERNPPLPAYRQALATTAPLAAWHLFVTLSPAERVSWLCWTWTAVWLWRRRAPAGAKSRSV